MKIIRYLQVKVHLEVLNHHTLRIPNIRGLDSDTKDISKSMMDMMTSEPSMMFQPDVKYASGP